ncbi:MAG: hypothetical protein GC158_04905 [Cyanobacteria bacterium RI_101]|nr:hypothetical protein [Cyanobacteria bacterium RI_101]
MNVVTTVFADADGALAGNQALGTNNAALVRVNNSPVSGIYLVINDNVSGFQDTTDLVVNVTGLKGTLPALGTIPVGNFFV